MDEHILKDFFLKVGRSYYTSDEYHAELLHKVRDTSFKPTSRFGIGILSCFLNDPENTVVEVLTRRYSDSLGDNKPVYRLNVTGLHGYYSMTKPERGQNGPEMHRPSGLDGSEDGYLHKVGTTICVRTSKLGLGGTQSFKQLMDKYLCFPEVRVEYHELGEQYIYPTRTDVMDLLHSLNDNDSRKKIRNHIHSLPDSVFEEIIKATPFINWHETDTIARPTIILQYYPLDWFSKTNNISGFEIKISADVSVTCPPIYYKGLTFESELGCSVEVDHFSDSINLLLFSKTLQKKSKEVEQFVEKMTLLQKKLDKANTRHNKVPDGKKRLTIENPVLKRFTELTNSVYINIPLKSLMTVLSEDEQQIFTWIINSKKSRNRSVRGTQNGYSAVAYNGILADTDNIFYRTNNKDFYVTTLLRGDENCPNVFLNRDNISSLPLETACILIMAQSKMLNKSYHYYNIPSNYMPEQWYLLSTMDFWNVLDRHPNWEKRIRIRVRYSDVKNRMKIISLSDLEKNVQRMETVLVEFHSESLMDYLCLAALRRRFTLWEWLDERRAPAIAITKKVAEPDLSAFPPNLFFQLGDENSLLRISDSYYAGLRSDVSFYNVQHVFSRWLIEHQNSLQNQVPGLYNTILETMIEEDSTSAIIERINSILSLLQNITGNPFHIHSDLFIKETDLR